MSSSTASLLFLSLARSRARSLSLPLSLPPSLSLALSLSLLFLCPPPLSPNLKQNACCRLVARYLSVNSKRKHAFFHSSRKNASLDSTRKKALPDFLHSTRKKKKKALNAFFHSTRKKACCTLSFTQPPRHLLDRALILMEYSIGWRVDS